MSALARERIFEDRLDAIRHLVQERGAPAAMLRTRRNFAWATVGGENHVVLSTEHGVAGLLVTASEVVVLTTVIEAARIRDEELGALPVEVRSLPWHEQGAIDDAAERIAGGPPLNDAALEDELIGLRSVLSEFESDRLGWLAERAVTTLEAVLETVARGVTELEIAAAIAVRLGAEGVRAPVLLVAADERIDRYRHPLPTARQVEQRSMVGMVAERWGLHAAVSRFAELTPPSGELHRRLEAAREVHAVMATATRPGATLGDVLSAGIAAYAETGFPDEWQLHHQGGTIGYQGRERIAMPDDPTVIRPGMALAWNPSITGAKAEETLLVHIDGARVLTSGTGD